MDYTLFAGLSALLATLLLIVDIWQIRRQNRIAREWIKSCKFISDDMSTKEAIKLVNKANDIFKEMVNE